jgi:hypothetical protein
MKYQLPDETLAALHNLLHVASKEKVFVAGFAFSEGPIAITNFGNCTDSADLELYRLLCQICEEKRKAGLTIVEDLQKPV